MDKQQQRLLEAVKATQANCRFEDLARLLEAFGYVARETGSSHVVFRRPGRTPLSVPRHRPVNRTYVRQALAAIAELEKE